MELKNGHCSTAALKKVNIQSVKSAAKAAKTDGADTIVVALLHCYANSTNEQQVKQAIKQADEDVEVTLSSCMASHSRI